LQGAIHVALDEAPVASIGERERKPRYWYDLQ